MKFHARVRHWWTRCWPPARRRAERIYQLEWDLWLHCLCTPSSPLVEHAVPAWHARYVELTTELDALQSRGRAS